MRWKCNCGSETVSRGYERIGCLPDAQGKLAGAREAYRAALAIREQLALQDPGSVTWRRALWVSCWRVADFLEKLNRAGEAQVFWRRTCDTLSGHVAAGFPHQSSPRPGIFSTHPIWSGSSGALLFSMTVFKSPVAERIASDKA